jgi:hypothetical protein
MPYSASQASKSWRRARARLPPVNRAVIGDLSDRPSGQEEGLCRLVRSEPGFGQNQAVQRWIEDVNAQWGDAQPRLGQPLARE